MTYSTDGLKAVNGWLFVNALAFSEDEPDKTIMMKARFRLDSMIGYYDYDNGLTFIVLDGMEPVIASISVDVIDELIETFSSSY